MTLSQPEYLSAQSHDGYAAMTRASNTVKNKQTLLNTLNYDSYTYEELQIMLVSHYFVAYRYANGTYNRFEN